jgi:hypothetical protein
MATDYDVSTYQETGRWHFIVLKLMDGRAGASTPIYDSKADNRNGFDTREEAKTAGIAYKVTVQ